MLLSSWIGEITHGQVILNGVIRKSSALNVLWKIRKHWKNFKYNSIICEDRRKIRMLLKVEQETGEK